MGIRVGIDLGTTFSAVAWIDPANGKPMVIKNRQGSGITPSVLCFEPSGTVLFGEDAKMMQSTGDLNSVAFFKRSMGQDAYQIEFHGKTYTATDLSAIFLQKLVADAEAQIGEKIDAAVITVPAYFTHKERAATMEAGKRAGLDVIAIINEPTAAAFAYGLNEKEREQTVLIYDLGGGTFDITLARINQNEIEILGSDGNHELGGKDWDDCIARYLDREFYDQCGVRLSEDPEQMTSLLVTAEHVKKQLTSRDLVSVPLAYQGVRGNIEMSLELFESISDYLMGATRDVTQRLLDSLRMRWSQVDGVILVGGSTRMRMIHGYVQQMCGKPPLSGVNVDEAVALGAAIRANINEQGKAVPAIGGKLDSGASECIPMIQGAKAIRDVTAHSLGMISIREDGEAYVNSIIIPKHTKIPTGRTKPFALKTRRRRSELEVYVLQGEQRRPLDNTVVHKYVISEIERVNSGAAIIEVTYEYTINGVIEVSAKQKETRKVLPIRIEPIPDDMSWTDLSPKEVAQNARPTEVDVILAIDLSPSMRGEPEIKAMEAMRNFVEEMSSGSVRIGIIAFAVDSRFYLEPTDDLGFVYERIPEILGFNVGGGTTAEPFTLANEYWSVENKKENKEKKSWAKRLLSGSNLADASDRLRYIVVLTDGLWAYPESSVLKAKKCHEAGIEVMALGFGDADWEFLKKIASVDEFASMTDLANLSASFTKIAQAIGEYSTGLRMN